MGKGASFDAPFFVFICRATFVVNGIPLLPPALATAVARNPPIRFLFRWTAIASPAQIVVSL